MTKLKEKMSNMKKFLENSLYSIIMNLNLINDLLDLAKIE